MAKFFDTIVLAMFALAIMLYALVHRGDWTMNECRSLFFDAFEPIRARHGSRVLAKILTK